MRANVRRLVVLGFSFLVTAGGGLAQSAPNPPTPPTNVQPAGVEPTLAFGGLIQAQLEAGDRGDSRWANGNDRFLLRRARLNGTGRFLQDFDFRVEIDLAGTLANTTGLRAQLTDGYINWNRYSMANVRVGQFKTPFGFEQLYSDPRLITMERSLVNDRLTLNRQLGAQASGDLLDKRLSYAVGEFNGNGANNNFNDNEKFALVGRLSGIPWQGEVAGQKASWSLGADAFGSEDTGLALPDLGLDSTPATKDLDNLFTGKRRGSGFDSQVHAGPLDFWVEYLATRFEPTDRLPFASFNASGWYAQASWIFCGGHLQAVAKAESFDPDDRVSGDAVTTQTYGLNYLIKGHDLKLMLDYLRTDLGSNNPLPRQQKLLARLQVIF
ncbi:MAG TPA: porin [Thermoanaerobaculia bacterium]|nr:porin [Thermoanaerobaculia bacterium]